MWLYQPLDIQLSSPPRSATQKEVVELQEKLQMLEFGFLNLEEQKKKRERKKTKKREKLRKKRHHQKAIASNKAVKLLLEEETLAGKYVVGAEELLEKSNEGDRKRLIKAYKELFGRDVKNDITEAATDLDEYYEQLEEGMVK